MDTYTNIDWLKANHIKIHPFGLGFIQVKLNEIERMHFWHPAFKREREEVHDHRYDFASSILRGVMYQEIYTFNHAHQLIEPWHHEMVQTDCTPGRIGTDKVIAVGTLELVFSGILVAGTDYSMPMNTFHRLEAARCVTLVRRSDVIKTHARVVRNVGSKSVCPFSEKMDEEDMWALVDDCLNG